MLAPAIISVLPYVPFPPHYWQNAKCFGAVVFASKYCTAPIRSGLGLQGRCSAQQINNGNDCRGQSYHNSTAWPVAVPDIFLGFEKPSSAIDRCHSLSSLYLPPAAGRLLSCLSWRSKKVPPSAGKTPEYRKHELGFLFANPVV